MTLDEAIIHCQEKSCGDTECAKEHKQLGEWLVELKQRREQEEPSITEIVDKHFWEMLDEEPVSEDLEKAYTEYADERLSLIRPDISDSSYSRDRKMSLDLFDGYQIEDAFEAGAMWQKQQDSIPTKDLEELISTLSRRYPEVSFAKLSRIAVRVAKWQKEQFEKNRLKHCNSITNEQAELEQGFIDQHLDKHQRMPTFLDAIEYGMMVQKEQMMAKAVDGEVTYGKSLAIPSLGWVLDKEGLDYGDKVKLIIIKKD